MTGKRVGQDRDLTTTTTSGEHDDRRRDGLAYLGLSAAALVLTVAISRTSAASFARFYGGAEPAVVVIAASLAGGVALAWLRSRYGFRVLRGRATLRGIAVSAALATVLAVPIVLVDTALRYPEDTNVPVPQALAFYPAVGYVAELVFQVVPLAIILLVLSPFRDRVGRDRLVWLAIGLVATLEPTFQVLFEEDPLSPLAAYTWVHVFAISFLQLAVFRRYDFVSMLSLRLVYYAYWHILWGTIRLEVLF
jgi:hypothetical protein